MSSRLDDSRPANETTLDAYVDGSVDRGPDPSADDGGAVRPASAPTERVADLAAIFERMTGVETFVAPQAETPSHDPIESREHVAPDLSEDGLDDAADSDLQLGDSI